MFLANVPLIQSSLGFKTRQVKNLTVMLMSASGQFHRLLGPICLPASCSACRPSTRALAFMCTHNTLEEAWSGAHQMSDLSLGRGRPRVTLPFV